MSVDFPIAHRDLNHPESQKRAVYAAFESHDPRFDGQVFVGVSSTGIYCRTVCSARMPKIENCTGVRLPGCFDPFETACRAVLGQQVTVAAANKLAARVVEAHGARVETGIEGLTHAFPTPSEVLALDPIEDALGQLGVIRSRSRTIAEIARLLDTGELDLGPGALVSEQMERLLAVKGVGPWSANYIVMRTMSCPDAFLETDAGVRHALPDLSPREALELAEQWRPWRSYAVMSLWSSLM